MDKSKSKIKGIFKGVAVGFSFILCSAFFPANAISLAEENNYSGTTNVNTNTNRIEVGQKNASEQSSTVEKGQSFEIPVGEYYGKSSTAHTIGQTSSDITSSVVVKYQATGDTVLTISNKANASEVRGQSFVAEKLGAYTITYTVIDNGIVYSYDLIVVCQASEASFEFDSNEKNVIPSVYDAKIAEGKDIVLPLPSVNDEEGENVISNTDKNLYTLDSLGSGIDEGNTYVYIAVTNGSENLTVEKNDNGDFYISGSKIAEKIESLKDREIKITYSYYQKKGDKGVFITSTSKTFTIKDGYYYKDSDKSDSKRGYDIVASWSTSVPDSAVVGVEKPLPSVSATTKASNSPASESVAVYYEIQVLKMDNSGKYTEDVTSKVITSEGKFKAVEEGSYKFVYTVKDFYGNTATTSNTTFTIDKVKDTQSPDVYMFDAGDYTVKDGVYSSAENKLKTQTVARNIVMYAIAGNDNMVLSENLTLRREIRDASGIKRFSIDEKAYNSYNLIFAPAKADQDSIYKQIVQDNYEIQKQILMEDKAIDNDDVIKAWLLENHYLIVTTEFNKDAENKEIKGDLTENSEDAVSAHIEAGYAYIPSENSNKQYTFTNQSYSFYYYANDGVNNNKEKSTYYKVELKDEVNDSSVPTITFTNDLQGKYLPTETIKFNVASATDSIDSRLETVTAYRFLGNNKTAVASNQTPSTISYLLKNNNAKDNTKWYVTSKDSKGIVKSEGWFVDQSKSSYSINLKSAPQEAKYVEILAYAVDDYGNVGFYNKVIEIADAQDEDRPVLYKVVNIPSSSSYSAPSTISLPTLYFTDAKAEYMHAEVKVYKLLSDGSKKAMQSNAMSTKVDTNRGVFTVDAGSFNASSAGNYQIAVSVTDSGNHSVTTYFNYNVTGGAVIEDPEISNITTETKEIAIDESLYLVPPTLSISDSDDYAYVGLEDGDDQNTSTYYTTSIVSASDNNYELDQYYFTGKAKGTYKLQYNVFLLRYKKGDSRVSVENGTLTYNNGTKYYVYYEYNPSNKTYELHANTDKLGLGSELDTNSIPEDLIKGFDMTSDVQTIKVSEVVIKLDTDELDKHYEKTNYETVGETLTIIKPSVTVSGEDKGNTIDREESTVQISVTSGSSTTTLATIKLSEWENAVQNDSNFEVNGSTIKLKLSRNGKYTIKYTVQAQDYLGQNVGDTKTKEISISNGDTVAPTLELKDVVKTKYKLGETLYINMSGISASDTVTTDVNKLLSTLTVKLTNEDTDSSWTLDNEAGDGVYAFSKKLETAGNYTLSFTVKDEANNSSTKSVSFTVSTDKSEPADVKEILGGVLIGVSVALLAGVVAYFVVSKVKLDKKEKGFKNTPKNKD